ncbi:hypothetical protein Moror_16588 [Moniliophthora roreri MCA 2997]|uniref:Integral membrane protein n=1 Tax=Moniliophthora roreri (strain MCA 2997) TaxID=1381753 RepID=V2WXK4_MONRO|nr:hypothetical protein Moror_16588 [Moniliophthora roreri MCA 2997]
MPTIEETLEPFLSVRNILVEPISTLCFMFFIYGLYVVIFTICVYVLTRRAERPNRGLYLTCIITLFVLITACNTVVTVVYIDQSIVEFTAAKTRKYRAVLKLLTGQTTITRLGSVIPELFPVLINIVADFMLIHRCHIIWGSRKRIGIPLFLVSFVVNAIGLAAAIVVTVGSLNYEDDRFRSVYATGGRIRSGFFVTNAVFNSILTLMTAGRIWWITRKARKLLGQSVDREYNTIVAAILESGIVYPVVMIIRVIITYANDPTQESLVPIELVPVVYQAAGIAPTLIIVRVSLGKTVDSVNQMLSTLHFAEREAGDTETRQKVDDTDISRVHNVDFDDPTRQPSYSGSSRSNEGSKQKMEPTTTIM